MNRLPELAAGLAGAYDLGFAAFHMMFWRLFRWPRTLIAAGALNSAITQTLNVVLTYVFIVAGLALMWSLASGQVAMLLAGAGAGFWLLRAAMQPTLFERSGLSHAMTILFLAGALLHATPLILNLI